MAGFSIENFGCRATEADAAALRHGLLAGGLAQASGHERADIVVLNTCTVTAAADAQAREAVRKIHRANPTARIVVTGCYAQRAPEELARLAGVAWVVGNAHQGEIPEIVLRMLEQGGAEHLSTARASTADFVPLASLGANILISGILAHRAVQVAPAARMAGDRTRPILKIQDGCDSRCAFCVIPSVRGRSRSLTPEEVIREAQALVAAGAREIVLSGINLGSYGRDLMPRAGLAALTRRILQETALEQLRFSSIEPQDITEDFVALAAESSRIAPHFHVPLQSGADRILRAMHRWYRAAHYAERVKLIRRLLPDAGIGADVMAGFPGEAEADFEATMEFIESLPFTYLHVFSFSARPGTEGARLEGAPPERVIHERARKLRALGERKAAAFRASQAGRTVRALTLARGGENWTEAMAPNYLKVRINGRWPANQWHSVRLGRPENPARPEP